MKLLLVIHLLILLIGSADSLARQLKGDAKPSVVKDQSSSPLQFHVAPMQGYTNYATRMFFRKISPLSKLWTEMEKVPDLIEADAAALARRLGPPGHKDIALQLGGNDPANIRQCMRHLSNHGYSFDEINLNCGCPSIESGGATLFGASLMKQPKLTRELIAAVREATATSDTRLSLKCRTAVYDTIEDMIDNEERAEEDYQCLHDYIEHAKQGGISHLVLHARPVVLSGLSPTKNRQVPPIDYSVVQRVAREFPSLDVTLNGGISGYAQLQKFLTTGDNSEDLQVSSYMAGRWILRRPLDMALVQTDFLDADKVSKESSLTNSKVAIDAVKLYTQFLMECVQQSSFSASSMPSLNDLCLPLFMISEQLREDYEYDAEEEAEESNNGAWLEFDAMEEMYDCICETVQWLQEFRRANKQTNFSPQAMEFNKLSSSLKSLVGAKVVGKWKRNRSEL